MNKYFAIALLISINIGTNALAATISGDIVDEQTGKPLSYYDIEAKLLEKTIGGSYTVVDTARPIPSSSFAFHNVAPGQYAVEFVPSSPHKYQWEIFDDAQRPAGLTPVTVATKRDEISLGTIAIAPPRLQIVDASISPNQGQPYAGVITADGGTMELSGTLLNHGDTPQSLLVWAVAAESPLAVPAGSSAAPSYYYPVFGKAEIAVGEQRIEAKPGQTPFRVTVNIPSLSAANIPFAQYAVTLFAGKNRWDAQASSSDTLLIGFWPDNPAGAPEGWWTAQPSTATPDFQIFGASLATRRNPNGTAAKLSAGLANHTGKSATLTVWLVLEEDTSNCQEPCGPGVAGLMEPVEPLTLEVPAGSTQPFDVNFTLPAAIARNHRYLATLYAGFSRWDALAASAERLSIPPAQ